MTVANLTKQLNGAFDANFNRLPIAARASVVSALNWFLAIDRNYKTDETSDASEAIAAPIASANDANVARLRAAIVARIWEPDLRSELVDRIVGVIGAGWVDVRATKAAIRKAAEARADYERTNGTRGVDSLWKPLATWLKGVYEANGAAWTPTASAIEPQPKQTERKPRRVITLDGAVVYENEL